MRKKIVKLLLFSACLYLAGCAELHGGGVGAGDERRSFQEITDDAKITSTIKTEYFKDELVHSIRINVDTHRGVVTLHGYADHQEEATRAINIALDTPGVTKVISNLVIENQAMSPRGVIYYKAPAETGDTEPPAPQQTDR